jgi:glycosyltransferase involved in cell wall biosynthesis
MSEPVRVSVVIPAFNSSRFIDDALASVARQTRRASEVVVIDDGSQDDTSRRAAAWADRLSPTRFLLLGGPNGGISVARNRGVLASTCDVVAFLDADDVFEPDHLAALAPAFELYPDLSLAFADMTQWGGVNDGHRMLAPVRDALHQNSCAGGVDEILLLNAGIRNIYLRTHRIVPSSWLVARQAFAAAGLFDPTLRFAEDVDFLCPHWAIQLGAHASAG